MSKTVLHIGLHKTATTTLQHQLFPRTEGLNLFVTLQQPMRDFMQMVTRKDPAYFDPDAARALLAPDWSSTQVNLLSNESFSGPPYAGVIEGGLDHRTPILSNLQSTFPDAYVVLVIRRQDKLAQSFYRQYLKSGGTRKVRRFFGMASSEHPPLFSLDRFFLSPYIAALYAAFPGKVLILPFEQFVQEQGVFLDQLGSFMGVEFPDLTLTRENATTLGPAGLEFTRWLNHLFRNLLNPAGLIPGLPVKRRGKLRPVSPLEYLHDHAPSFLSGTGGGEVALVAQEILNMVKEDNQLLERQCNLDLKQYGYC